MKNDQKKTLEGLQALLSDISEEEIKANLRPTQDLMSCYRCAIMEVETKFRVLNDRFSLEHERNPIDSIKSRLKAPESIKEKLERKGFPLTLESMEENLTDIAGVKIICSFVEDIYMVANCLVEQDDVTLIEWKDYIKTPKENGYRSLHLIIETPIYLQEEKKNMKVEVQFRTIAMEFWASLEHRLRYKKKLDKEKLEYTEDELKECAKLSSVLDEKMQGIRNIIEEE